MNKIKESYILPSFLVAPGYRIWRHLLLLLSGAIITSNLVFIAYQDCIDILGNNIYLICFSSFIIFVIAVYINLYLLIPRFLLKGKYIAYTIVLFLIIYSLPTISIIIEYWVRNSLGLSHRITSYTNPLILVDNLASFMMYSICSFGMSILVLFRQWISRNEQISLMENEHLKTELNKLKGQITPGFLSKTLAKASASVETEPKKTTAMLMKLGQLLRYQLYDCNRERVLLQSEINFLTNFLDLEKLNKDQFRYEIHKKGNFSNVSVSPLLFITLIQNIVESSTTLGLYFNVEGESLLFRCESGNTDMLSEEELSSLKKRLDLQYPGKYNLISEKGIVRLQINISE